MAENIKSGKYYRVFNGTDWDRMHFVTDAKSVYANDGNTLESKVGAIKGITTSTDVTEEGYAADAKTVSECFGGLKFGVDAEGNYGYYKAGADTVTPFKTDAELVLLGSVTNNGTVSATSIKDYQKLTADNFVIKITNINLSQSAVAGHSNMVWIHNISSCRLSVTAPSLSYNASSGVATVSLPRGAGGGNTNTTDYGSTSWSLNTTANIYCIV